MFKHVAAGLSYCIYLLILKRQIILKLNTSTILLLHTPLLQTSQVHNQIIRILLLNTPYVPQSLSQFDPSVSFKKLFNFVLNGGV